MKHRAARPLLAAIALAWGTPVLAADGGWNYRIVPYVWGASIDGTLAHDRLPVDVHPSASFSDIWNNLDFAAMAAFEAQRDRHGVVAELVTLRLSGTARMPIPPLGASVPVELDGDSTTVVAPESAAIRLRLDIDATRYGRDPGGRSLTSRPTLATRECGNSRSGPS